MKQRWLPFHEAAVASIALALTPCHELCPSADFHFMAALPGIHADGHHPLYVAVCIPGQRKLRYST
eukprot:scaffold241518_cov22-Tisochrysis_lutea.AAC.1